MIFDLIPVRGTRVDCLSICLCRVLQQLKRQHRCHPLILHLTICLFTTKALSREISPTFYLTLGWKWTNFFWKKSKNFTTYFLLLFLQKKVEKCLFVFDKIPTKLIDFLPSHFYPSDFSPFSHTTKHFWFCIQIFWNVRLNYFSASSVSECESFDSIEDSSELNV